jgi:anti-sigma factor ChrR (cupin superfamily)
LSRVGDIIELRETATQRLGRNYTKSSADPGSPKPTSDLGDISKKALDAAAEREQLVSTSDLINTFPKIGDRLTYASGEGARTNALVQAIENGLVPRVADSMSKIQTVVTEAMEQSQTVQRMLQDLNAKQTFEAEQRQIAFMEDIRRQVREAVDAQVGVALKQFGDDLMRRLEEATAEKRTADGESIEPRQPQVARLRTNPWNWLGLL